MCTTWSSHRSRRIALLQRQDGTSAIEFAIVAPAFLLLLLGIISFGTLLGTYHGLQQLVAEATRASVAGLDSNERATIARGYIARNADSYPFIDGTKLTVTTTESGPGNSTFQVNLRYDMSDSFVFRIGEMLPLPSPIIVRTAAIQRGGY
jgi:Flp pilus assembly protein TadG